MRLLISSLIAVSKQQETCIDLNEPDYSNCQTAADERYKGGLEINYIAVL